MTSGTSIAVTIFVLQLTNTLFGRSYEQIESRIKVIAKTILVGAVFEKSLKLSPDSVQRFDQGRILNMINIDVETVVQFVQHSHTSWIMPLQVVATIVLLQNLIGNAVYCSLFVLFVSVLVQAAVMAPLERSQHDYLEAGDRRLNTLREMLCAMRAIKLHGWEPLFKRRIDKLREDQVAPLRKSNWLNALFFSAAQITPIAMPVVGIVVWIVWYAPDQYVDPAVVFPAIALYQLLVNPLWEMPTAITALAQALVSFRRLRSFLLASELRPLQVQCRETLDVTAKAADGGASALEPAAIVIEDASFAWKRDVEDNDEGSVGRLRNINLRIPKGKLTCIVGPVGAGKSSLLSAIIGEMATASPQPAPSDHQQSDDKSGRVAVFGSIAYAPQQPWILTDTVEGNVAFASSSAGDSLRTAGERERRMQYAVTAAALEKDLAQLPKGKQTLIGEKGANLSGGQQARVALARAVYEDADIYLLDDPLSALDTQVGTAIFNNCIKGALASKTVVLVTHHLHLLPSADLIIVIANGSIAQSGTFSTLAADPKGPLATMLRDHSNAPTNLRRPPAADTDSAAPTDPAPDPSALTAALAAAADAPDLGSGPIPDAAAARDIVQDEERASGALSPRVWRNFLRASGVPAVAFIAAFALIQQAAAVAASLWLTWWAQGRVKDVGVEGCVGWFVGLGVVQGVALVIWNALVIFSSYKASKFYHEAALSRLVRAPMSFFDSQPVGRILNRFSKDIEAVDQQLWHYYFLAIFSGVQLLGAFALIIVYFPILLAVFVPLIIVFGCLLVFYRTTKRELKRLDSNQRSSLNAHISESLSGVPIIRAFRAETRFIARQRLLTDLANSPRYLYLCAPVWVSIRIELLTAFVTLAISLLGVTNKVDASAVGLTLTYALVLIENVGYLIKALALVESEMNSVERLEVYSRDVPIEAATEMQSDPDKSWPEFGAIEIRNLEVHYPSRPGYPVLRDFSIDIKPGEKIGVVGRTGSGKSTLLAAFLRLLEPSAGTIRIDGIDTSAVGLAILRSRLHIITQDPVLFSGSLRSNLDHDARHPDAAIWRALDDVGLRDLVARHPRGLDLTVDVGGKNFSVGQRQMVCLARAILHAPRILVLDEATASADPTADRLLARTVARRLPDATVVAVAHRLHTVAALDRVVVLDAGVAVEVGRPVDLLARTGGRFRALAEAGGRNAFERVLDAAEEAERERSGAGRGDGADVSVVE
ncbi:P-loop containing nucleoside triphosphate hydrolase protein [Zopfochytrium polystomum]|nr:P-loop containing nucleoside triphosphate hydrolase protein [Zopfochytrium polystomum]